MIIIGVDEVGLGPIAGPVVTAAVAIYEGHTIPGLTDSKKLSDSRRRALVPKIEAQALHWVIARSGHKKIDKYGIRRCKLACMTACVRRCFLALPHIVEIAEDMKTVRVIVDGIDPIPKFETVCTTMKKADLKIPAVSAASVIAKVYRDDWMIRAAARYPGYGFDKHMGYPTKAHLEALEKRGICTIHRRSYGPVKKLRKRSP